MNNYEIEYNCIVKNRKLMIYRGPEHQAASIKRCSILKQVKEIEYSNSVFGKRPQKANSTR